MEIVAIFGNGTSIPYNSGFQIDKLTEKILRRFTPSGTGVANVTEALNRLARAASSQDLSPKLTFEALLGPFDRIAAGVDALTELSEMIPGGDRHASALRDAAAFGHSLYRRAVGRCLAVVAELSTGQGEVAKQRSDALLDWIVNAVPPNSTIRVFTLNYDGLTDSAALDLGDRDSPDVRVSDMADGRSHSVVRTLTSGGRMYLYPLRNDEEYLAGEAHSGATSMVIYHLHGSLSWLQDSDGQVWKAHSIDRLRNLRFWSRFAQGRAALEPVVVLTDQKMPRISHDPFAWAYRRLRRSLLGADGQPQPDAIVIAGYGFGDEPLNRTLLSSISSSTCPILVIGSDSNPDRFRRTVARKLALQRSRPRLLRRLRTYPEGLPDAIQRLTWN